MFGNKKAAIEAAEANGRGQMFELKRQNSIAIIEGAIDKIHCVEDWIWAQATIETIHRLCFISSSERDSYKKQATNTHNERLEHDPKFE